MKTLIIVFLQILLMTKISWADTKYEAGELIFDINPRGHTVITSITQVANTDSWKWDNVNGNVVYYGSPFSYIDTTNTIITFSFGSPNSGNFGTTGRILPWGQFEIKITSDASTLTDKTIDFEDQHWSANQSYYRGSDTHIIIDLNSNPHVTYTTADDGTPYDFNSAGSEIYTIWGNDDPLLSSFKPPVFLENVINGQDAGGKLNVGSINYRSGDGAPVAYGFSYDIGTKGDGTHVDRFLDYQSTGITYKHNNWNQALSDYLITKNITVTTQSHQRFAYFSGLNSATIQSILLDNGSNLDSIQFRDPWYVESNGTQPNSFDTFASPFHPTGAYSQSSSGVFLGQDYNIPGNPYYSVQTPSTKTVSGYKATFTGWTVSPSAYTTFQSASSTSTPVVFSTTGATITANYKGSLASSASTAMNLPSQRKIARANDGTYYLIYESQGSIWVEYSSDAANWNLANNNQPIGSGTTPCITPNNWFGGAIVTFNNHSGTSSIYTVNTSTVTYIGQVSDGSNEITTPVVSMTDVFLSDILVMWKRPGGGIRYRIGNLMHEDFDYIVWTIPNTTLSGSDSYSSTPTAECMSNIFQIEWEEDISGGSDIDYTTLTRNGNGTYTQASVTDMSSGYPLNYSPSLIAASDGSARSCWISDDPDASYPVTIFTAPGYYSYWYFGGGVTSANINQAPGVVYVVGWVNDDLSQQYTTSAHLSNPQSLASSGPYVQIANGTSTTNLRSLGFNTGSSPYRFNLSSGIPYYKTGENEIAQGRGGMVTVNGAKFTFLLGDVVAGGTKVGFMEMADTVRLNGAASLNSFLETEPFTLQDGTPLSYAIDYRVRDSSSAVSALSNGKNVSFTVELVDAGTQKVIGSLNNCSYSSSQVVRHKSTRYDVDTKGIGNRTVKMRIRVNTNADAQFAVVSKVARGTSLGKKGAADNQTINFTGSLAVADYGLDQNFPNPFNPSTTISYQLPKASHVTLKVYDMVGRAIATLVNEDKEQGRYTATFDASRLSSGVYISKLTAGDFTKTMKMVLMK